MGKLFGTDGIRGKANVYPITAEIAVKAGRAVGLFVIKNGYSSVIIGKDTRLSGDMLESAIAAGIASVGAQAIVAGVIPTPGIAFLCTKLSDAGAGIVLSASHNPYEDNGIKIFKHGGIKLSDDEEKEIEDYILSEEQPHEHHETGKIVSLPNASEKYAQFLINTLPEKITENKKLKIIIDCSNGAASEISQLVFNSNLFDTKFIHNSPDGININHACGSQHTEDLQREVVKQKADIGLAFDGDADRLIVVDETGAEITGDRIIAICGKFAQANNQLNNNIVVSTIMSNIGLGLCLDDLNIKHIMAGVGDRLVLEEMKKSGAVIGGEDSGHMIFLNHHSTGDGMLSALKLIEVMLATNQSLSELKSIMTVYPQVLKNVEVDTSRPDFTQNKSIADTINTIKEQLGDKGRVLIRYSGTQPLLRVMVEGPEQDLTERLCDLICNSIRKNI